jgi:hypothetical protein
MGPTGVDFLTPEDGAGKLYRNVEKDYHSALLNIPEERRTGLLVNCC